MGNICDRFFQLQVAVFKFLSALMKDPELGIYCSGQLSHIGVMAGYVDQHIYHCKYGTESDCCEHTS